jgi:hypothetical protein
MAVGGAPISQMFADEIGADGYGANASAAVDLFFAAVVAGVAVANYRILYWQEIPTQIKAEDEADDVTVMLDGKFMQQVDILAAKRGLQAADDYLAQWKWSEEAEREGSAREVAEALKAELEAKGW